MGGEKGILLSFDFLVTYTNIGDKNSDTEKREKLKSAGTGQEDRNQRPDYRKIRERGDGALGRSSQETRRCFWHYHNCVMKTGD